MYKCSESTRTRILETSKKLFFENGFVKTTTRDISKHAQVNIGSITYQFGAKMDIGALIVTDILGAIYDISIELFPDEIDAFARTIFLMYTSIYLSYNYASYRELSMEYLKSKTLTKYKGEDDPKLTLYSLNADFHLDDGYPQDNNTRVFLNYTLDNLGLAIHTFIADYNESITFEFVADYAMLLYFRLCNIDMTSRSVLQARVKEAFNQTEISLHDFVISIAIK